MKSILFFATCIISYSVFAQDPIFQPTMAITGIGVVDSPPAEGVENIIDANTATKFLDFALEDGMGFTVDLGGVSAIPTSIEVTTANDFPVRDPINWELLGSNDGGSFVTIDSGIIDCITDRFFTRDFAFDNGIDFQWLQVNFTNACDPSGGAGIPSIQVAEVQIYGQVLGLSTNALSNQFVMFPNPAIDMFTIDYRGTDPLVKANIYDLIGKRILTLDIAGFVNQKQFDVSPLQSGLYFVKLETTKAATVKQLLIK